MPLYQTACQELWTATVEVAWILGTFDKLALTRFYRFALEGLKIRFGTRETSVLGI